MHPLQGDLEVASGGAGGPESQVPQVPANVHDGPGSGGPDATGPSGARVGLGMFACAACGVGGYFLFLSNPLVGKWEGDLLVVKIEFDFYRGGTGKVTVKNPVGVGIGGAPRNAEETAMHFNYIVTGSNPMILAIEPTKVDANERRNMFAGKDRPGRLRVTLEGDTMTLVEDEPRGGIAIPITLKRVR
jgi:hypothetical protein